MLWIDRKYIGLVSPRLDRYKQKSDTLWNFRCPFCGDSQKNRSKTRGYLFVRGSITFFKCHNCTVSLNLYQFLEKLEPSLAKAYSLEIFENKPKEELPKPDPKIKHRKIEELFSVGAIPVRESIRAMDYLHTRRIPEDRYDDLYYFRDYSNLIKLNSDYKGRLVPEERIAIPLLSKKGSLMGVCGRSLGSSNKRYVNVRLHEGILMYGYQHVDEKKPIYACEGAFDSMFLNNCIAVLNSGLHQLKDKILIFDNEPRNENIVIFMRKASKHSKVVVFPPSWKYKDINEAIMAGVSREEIQQLIYNNTFEKLELQMKIQSWQKAN